MAFALKQASSRVRGVLQPGVRLTHRRARLGRRGPVGAPRSVSYFTFGRRKICEPYLVKMRDEKCVA